MSNSDKENPIELAFTPLFGGFKTGVHVSAAALQLPDEELAARVRDGIIRAFFDEAAYAIQLSERRGTLVSEHELDARARSLEELRGYSDEFDNLLERFYDLGREALLRNAEVVAQGRTRSPRPARRAGWVYLFGNEEQATFKIGHSRNPVQRLADTLPPFPVKPIHQFRAADMRRVEASLHARFAEQRLHGEWFRLSADDVAWFKTLADNCLDGGPEGAQ